MICRWCGDAHGVDQLCQRAERGLTRRSFCFLFGAGLAGLALWPKLSTYQVTGMTARGETVPHYIHAEGTMIPDATITEVRIYGSSGNGPHVLMATLPPIRDGLRMRYGDGLSFSDSYGQPVTPTWLAPAYRQRT